MSNPYQKYKNTSIQSASREKLLLMMYEGAIKFNKMAIKAAEDKKIAERCENIGRAFDIVLELNNTLDHKVGGPIAAQLEQLYMYVTEQYTKANISGEIRPLQDALKVLENLYEGWKQAIENLKKDKEKDKPETVK